MNTINTKPSVKIHLQRATVGNIDEIEQLYKDSINTIGTKDYSPEQLKAWIATFDNLPGWIRRIEEQHFYLALDGEKLAGFASIDYNGYLDLLYIDKAYQGKGVGTILLNKMEEKAKEMGFKEISVQSSINAEPFFLAKGFHDTGVKDKLVNGVPFRNTIMTKKL